MSAYGSQLFGRDRELVELKAALHAAEQGNGTLLLFVGEPGIGKTRLANDFADEASARGARVTWGRAWEAGGAPAYWPFEALRPFAAYPAVLLVTGVNDPRVAPWQSRKFAAALQAATSSKSPVLLLTRTSEGHGVTASFSQRVDNDAVALAFFAHELRLSPDATTRGAAGPAK